MPRMHPDREDWGVCITEDCSNFQAFRSLNICNKCYRKRSRDKGLAKGFTLDEIRDRFWSRVDIRSDEDCWPWTGAPHKHGHGVIWWNNVSYHAHTISYRLSNGDIPANRVVDHRCRNRICVNPSHLQAVTHKENNENVGLSANSPTGYRGVTMRGPGYNKPFRARVGHNGKVIHIGDYATAEEANEAVIAARLRMHTNNLIDRKENP